MTDLAKLGLEVDSRPLVRARDELGRLVGAAKGAEAAAANFGQAADKAGSGAQGLGGATQQAGNQLGDFKRKADDATVHSGRMSNQLGVATSAFGFLQGAIVGAFGALAAAISGGAFLKAAREFTDIQNSLRVAGVEAKDLASAFDKMYAAANRQGASVGGITQLFSRAMTAGDAFGVTNNEAAEFAEGIATSMAAAGTTAKEAEGALRQLGQALGSGSVQAEEFNGIMDGIYLATQAMANGLEEAEGSVSAFRNLVREGKISSEAMFRAFMAGLPTIQEMADRALPTVSQATQRVNNSFLVLSGNVDKILGVTEGLGRAFNALAMWIESNARPALELLAQDIAEMWPQISNASTKLFDFILVAGGLPLVTMAIMGVAGAVKALTLAMLANPVGALVSALVIAGGAAYAFRDEISQAIGTDVLQLVKDAANGMIGLFKGAFDAIVAGVSEIPAAFRKAFADAMNGAVQLVQSGINGIIGAFRMLPRMNGIPLADLSGFMSPAAPEASVGGAMGRAFGAARGVDYLGNIASGVRGLGGRAGQTLFGYAAPNQEENAPRRRRASTISLRDFANDNDSGSEGGAASASAQREKAWQNEVMAIERRRVALEAEARTIGMSTFEVERNRIANQLRQSAIEKQIAITPEMERTIQQTSTSLAQQTQELENQRNAWRGTQDAIRFAGQQTSSFLSDITSGGKNAADAMMNLLKRLTDVALQGILLGEGPLGQLFGASSSVQGKAGGVFGAIFNGITSLFGGARAEGGDVSSGKFYLVGEKGPELFAPGRSGTIAPNSALRGNDNRAQRGSVEVTVTVAPSGEFDSRVARVSGAVSQATVKQALDAFSSRVPGIVANEERRRVA